MASQRTMCVWSRSTIPVLVNEIVPVNLLRINDRGHVEVEQVEVVHSN